MKRLVIMMSMLLCLLPLAGCLTAAGDPPEEQPGLAGERVEELHTLSVRFTEYLATGETVAADAMMSDAMKKAMDGKLAATWSQLADSLGAFAETGAYVGLVSEGYDVLEMTLVFAGGTVVQRTVFDEDDLITGLFFRNGQVESNTAAPAPAAELPDGVTETAITVDAGEGYPLAGKLTLPEGGKPVAAVVLVHGSGPGNMDETVGANAPFRDIAYGLAAKRIAVLRYDKRTLTHGAAMAERGANNITIDEEAAFDALAAVKLLQEREETADCRIYLLGHSLGGGLLAYINSLGAGADGYIIMAGTPRNLWELSAEQNLLIADELEQGGDRAQAGDVRDFVEKERQRAAALAGMKADETLFGIPAPYLQKLGEIDAIALHRKDRLPVLVLQGESDRQVTGKDLTLWQAGLAAHPDADFRSYPGLNHLFGRYEGEAVPFSQLVAVEYAQMTPVAGEVVDDIAAWLTR
ncbi:MAG: alpha/beta fold hydrolase [Gracilibacteraceae bacterium]|jgi:dienelactone hydrolase|nr:alpha/beta fold hydrolase [Gracilibacteraceae bacterium]